MAASNSLASTTVNKDGDLADSPKKSPEIKTRLLVGEGNFSFTRVLLEQHPFKKEEIVATELKKDYQKFYVKPEDSGEDEPGYDTEALEYRQRVKNCLKELKSISNLTLQFGIDATKLNTHYKGRRFHRIYFNFPYRSERERTADMVKDFFISARKVQEEGDQILLTLVCRLGNEEKTAEEHRIYWHGLTYGIVKASEAGGYRLIKKRRFSDSTNNEDPHRYGKMKSDNKYIHECTDSLRSCHFTDDARQYVFEKVERFEYNKADIVYSEEDRDCRYPCFNEDMDTSSDTDDES
ncbi:unnamed protein product [Rotaria socialis]|uniref:25S rRNA (uridine-N(3))-methyltransferase BMT5-like domain-containing protein n=1 Tax=Rotaria socialis TaxID=392032 RepID=A0A820DP00_9BILA|nr:unnamed protein product [Rotaria socialis]CAF4235262.1 unnamed protein product [Rotaria socialis]